MQEPVKATRIFVQNCMYNTSSFYRFLYTAMLTQNYGRYIKGFTPNLLTLIGRYVSFRYIKNKHFLMLNFSLVPESILNEQLSAYF